MFRRQKGNIDTLLAQGMLLIFALLLLGHVPEFPFFFTAASGEAIEAGNDEVIRFVEATGRKFVNVILLKNDTHSRADLFLLRKLQKDAGIYGRTIFPEEDDILKDLIGNFLVCLILLGVLDELAESLVLWRPIFTVFLHKWKIPVTQIMEDQFQQGELS